MDVMSCISSKINVIFVSDIAPPKVLIYVGKDKNIFKASSFDTPCRAVTGHFVLHQYCE